MCHRSSYLGLGAGVLPFLPPRPFLGEASRSPPGLMAGRFRGLMGLWGVVSARGEDPISDPKAASPAGSRLERNEGVPHDFLRRERGGEVAGWDSGKSMARPVSAARWMFVPGGASPRGGRTNILIGSGGAAAAGGGATSGWGGDSGGSIAFQRTSIAWRRSSITFCSDSKRASKRASVAFLSASTRARRSSTSLFSASVASNRWFALFLSASSSTNLPCNAELSGPSASAIKASVPPALWLTTTLPRITVPSSDVRRKSSATSSALGRTSAVMRRIAPTTTMEPFAFSLLSTLQNDALIHPNSSPSLVALISKVYSSSASEDATAMGREHCNPCMRAAAIRTAHPLSKSSAWIAVSTLSPRKTLKPGRTRSTKAPPPQQHLGSLTRTGPSSGRRRHITSGALQPMVPGAGDS
eukprot:Hpha_TRINITY_DN16241_c5_g3::TRINITY_DN16241_c5_g3_i1::g.12240::m.12240